MFFCVGASESPSKVVRLSLAPDGEPRFCWAVTPDPLDETTAVLLLRANSSSHSGGADTAATGESGGADNPSKAAMDDEVRETGKGPLRAWDPQDVIVFFVFINPARF